MKSTRPVTLSRFWLQAGLPIRLLRTVEDGDRYLQRSANPIGLWADLTTSESWMEEPIRAKPCLRLAVAVLKTSDPEEGRSNVRPLSLAEAMLRKAIDLRDRGNGNNALGTRSKLSLELFTSLSIKVK